MKTPRHAGIGPACHCETAKEARAYVERGNEPVCHRKTRSDVAADAQAVGAIQLKIQAGLPCPATRPRNDNPLWIRVFIGRSPALRDDETIQLDRDECASLGGHGALCAPRDEPR